MSKCFNINKKAKTLTLSRILFWTLIMYILWPIILLFFGSIFSFVIPSSSVNFIFFLLLIIELILLPFLIRNNPKIKVFSKANLKEFFKNKTELALFAIFLVWAFISCFFSINPIVSMFGIEMVNGKIAVLQAFPMYLFYATIFVISYLVIKDKDFSKIFYTFSCMMIIMCVMTLIDKEGTIIYPFINHNSPYAGMFVNSNHFAYLLSMGILISACLFIFKKDIFMKTFYLISFALQVYTLNLNNTLGSFVAVILGLFMLSLLYAIKYRKFSLELIVVIMTFCACCMLALEKNMIIQIKDVVFDIFKVFGSIFGDVGGDVSGAGTNRWGLWLAAMQNMINYPIFGTGIDCYRFATPATSLMPHNEFLQIGSETGFIGIGLYLSALIILCVKYFKKLIKMNDNTFVVGIVVFTYLVSACFGNTMPHTFPYYMIFIGMLAYSLNKKEEYNQIS